jgi:hypothetical protein
MKSRKPIKSWSRRQPKGQVLVIVAFAITALVAFVGLVIDLGLVFIQYGRLRRAVDAAAIAASLQYRENYTIDSLRASAVDFLTLNGINDPAAEITVCTLDEDMPSVDDQDGEELALCDGYGHGNNNGNIDQDEGELRKFVHVIARTEVQLAFLRVLGIPNVPLAAEAVSEAASLDVVLVIDRSESMTWDAPGYSPERDPRYCNAVESDGWLGDCMPFDEVKHAAFDFVCENLFFPYDRVGIVTFDQKVHTGADAEAANPGNRGMYLAHEPNLVTACGRLVDQAVLTHIKQLTVFDPQWNVPEDDALVRTDYDTTAWQGGCTYYANDTEPCRVYWPPYDPGSSDPEEADLLTPRFFLNMCDNPDVCPDLDVPNYTSTNIGGALAEAGAEFAREGSRPEALWVVILLTDGDANSSIDIEGGTDENIFCPSGTHTQPYCNDGLPDDRHCLVDEADYSRCTEEGGVEDAANYDADDFARDMADFVGIGQQAIIFTIGMGERVPNSPYCAVPDCAEQLLRYTSEVGNGEYFYAPDADQLQEIFRQIADKIAVRITH